MAADTKRGAVFEVEVRNSSGRLYATVTLDAIGTALAAQGLYVVTAAEKAVLDACAAAELGEDDPYADPTEPQEVGEECYIYTDDQHAIARAELARREAAK